MNPNRERSFRTPALILKRRDFGEADRMLTVLTPGYGKLDVLAKGARKLTSHKTGQVELFTRADLLIHRGREIGQVAQAEMTAPYLALREDLTRGAYASYAVELLDRFTADEVETESVKLFALLDATLDRLCRADDARLALRFYELHLAALVGYRPELSQCVVGREPIQPQDQYFSASLGGVVCPGCALRAKTSLTPVTMNGLKLLRHLQRSAYDTVAALNVPPALHDEVERVMLGYLVFLLERRLQTVEFIRRIRE
jgi:DNA repair protein RecO (recombination protein O)